MNKKNLCDTCVKYHPENIEPLFVCPDVKHFDWPVTTCEDYVSSPSKWKIEQRIIVDGEISELKFDNEQGTIVKIVALPQYGIPGGKVCTCLGVRFDKPRNDFHTCSGICDENHGWFIYPESATRIEE